MSTCISNFSLSLLLAIPIIIDGPNDIAVVEGNNATFTCEVLSEPFHTLEWMFEGVTLENTSRYLISPIDQTLVIINTSLSIAGNYICMASNIHGASNSTGILEVQG